MKKVKFIAIFMSCVMLGTACTKKTESISGADVSDSTSKAVFQSANNTVEMKTITDHAGNTVEIPVEPKRIASLHTLSTTVMLLELEASLIGTATRIKALNNKPYIRGAEELFGTKFEDTGYFNYGTIGKDIEQVKASQPDLIVGILRHQKQYEVLSEIAPTILIDHHSPDKFKIYRNLAIWVGKEDVFDEYYKKYQSRLLEVKAKFNTGSKKQTMVFIRARADKGKIAVNQHFGAATKVAYDLGLQRMDFVKEQFPGDARGEI